MSVYAQITDLQTYVGSQTNAADPGVYEQITDRLKATTANSTVAQEALDTAEATIDSYLAIKYQVPVDTTNTRVAALVKGWSIRLAVFELFAGCTFMGELLDRIEVLYRSTMKTLEGIHTGVTTIPGLTPLAPPAQDGFQVKLGGNPRIYTADSLKSF